MKNAIIENYNIIKQKKRLSRYEPNENDIIHGNIKIAWYKFLTLLYDENLDSDKNIPFETSLDPEFLGLFA